MAVIRRIVDDRVFLLGLDQLYREAMKAHERFELRECAQAVADALEVQPADVPIEGYYSEEPALTAYFRLMRALQQVEAGRRGAVRLLGDFQRLHDVAASPLYGRATDVGKLLPVGSDALTEALEMTAPDWSVERLTAAAGAVARERNEFSLVALAARAGDAVVLAALRESVVLYAGMYAAGVIRYEYVWRVDPDLAAAAQRFIDTFKALFRDDLPSAVADHAETYWHACADNEYIGRCVRLAVDDSVRPVRHYHWAIRFGSVLHKPEVHAFWDTEIWTTQRYRQQLPPGDLWPAM